MAACRTPFGDGVGPHPDVECELRELCLSASWTLFAGADRVQRALGGRVASQETNEGGIADLEADGQVYHLKNAAHFAGSYQQSPGAAPAGTDPKALVMKNEKGVVVVLEVKVETGTNPYLALDTSDQDVKVTLER
jgi:hypothetical protein